MQAILFSLCCLLLILAPVLGQASPLAAENREQTQTFSLLPAHRQIVISGFTRARASLDITAEVSGRCTEITADIGDPIPADGLFAVIDSTLIQLELQANEVNIKLVQRRVRFDSRQVERYRRLLTSKSSSKVRLDELVLQLDQSRLKLDQLQVEKKRLQELLSRHRVKAPAGWQITRRFAEPDQWVAAGKVLAAAGDYRSLLVPLNVTPAELESIKQEQAVRLHLPGENMEGLARLYQVSPGFDPVSRKIKISLLLDPSTYDKLSLKQGGVRVEIPLTLADTMHGFLAPARAVAKRYDEHWLTRKNGKQVQVIVLGAAQGPDRDTAWLRITSPDIGIGEIFRLPPARQDLP